MHNFCEEHQGKGMCVLCKYRCESSTFGFILAQDVRGAGGRTPIDLLPAAKHLPLLLAITLALRYFRETKFYLKCYKGALKIMTFTRAAL